MSHRLLADASFQRALLFLDESLAAQAGRGRCSSCGERLHAADYPRKPRGAPPGLGPLWARRHSFCCSKDGCRKRMTPTSVRFLDRRVYTGVAVVLAAALAHGLSARRLAMLREKVGVDRRTLERWRRWWTEELPRSDFWTQLRGLLAEPVDKGALPQSLRRRIRGGCVKLRLVRLLRLLAPLSHSERMRARFPRVR